MVTRSTSYRLRASSPQPVKGQCDQLGEPPVATIGFVLQTFKAEQIVTDSCEDKSQLLCSTDMVGLGGNFTSASYSAQRFLDPDTNEIIFTATETRDREIILEDDVPGASNL